MNNNLIKLVVEMNKVYDEYLCDCGCFDELIDEFDFKLTCLFNDDLDDSLKYIKSLDTRIFTEQYFRNKKFDENEIRKAIENYINSDSNEEKIIFDFDLLLKYIENDYRLINYSNNLSKDEIKLLAIKNPKILYLIENIDFNDIIEIMENNSETALVIDGDILNDEQIDKNSYLFKIREKLLENEKIYNLYIEGLKKYLKQNPLDYINASKEARNDILLASFVLKLNTKLIAYTSENVKNNKGIMMDMLKLDKSNSYYIGDSLKEDRDIKDLLK